MRRHRSSLPSLPSPDAVELPHNILLYKKDYILSLIIGGTLILVKLGSLSEKESSKSRSFYEIEGRPKADAKASASRVIFC